MSASSLLVPTSTSQISPIIPVNLTKHALKNGSISSGCMVAELRQPSVMQLLKNAGLDFVVIDNEHGPFSIETIADLCRYSRLIGLTPIVRVPDHDYTYIAQSLDSGAQGIMFPRVNTAEQVRELVQRARFPPSGTRGNALARGYTDFKGGDVISAMKAKNDETMLIIQIETKEAVENVEKIVAVEGVDAVLIGPNDLSIALGVPGDQNCRVMQDAIQRVIQACNQSQQKVVPGIHINDGQLAVEWTKRGMRFVSSNSECGFLVEGASAFAKSIKQAAATN